MSPDRGLAAITGATGFLGQHVVRALADDGWRVRILARRDPVSLFWSGLTPEVVRGDLFDQLALKRLSEGADVVVHIAGQIGGRKRDLDRINIEGSRNVAKAVLGANGSMIQIPAWRRASRSCRLTGPANGRGRRPRAACWDRAWA